MNLRLHAALSAFAGLTLTASGLAAQAPTIPAVAQSSSETSAVSLTFGTGDATSEWFSGLYNYGVFGPPPDDRLGGLTVGLRVLVGTRALDSRLRLGGELGVFLLKDGDFVGNPGAGAPGGTIVYTGAGARPDDAGIQLGALAALRLGTVGRIALRVEGGGGLVFFNLDEAGPAQKINYAIEFNTGQPYFESTPSPEPYFTFGIAPAIALLRNPNTGAALISIDPFFTVLQTSGDANVRSVTYGASFTLNL